MCHFASGGHTSKRSTFSRSHEDAMSDEHLWLVVGFVGQAFFSLRFLVQWIASERRRESVIPISFWFFSIGGGVNPLFFFPPPPHPGFLLPGGAGVLVLSPQPSLIFVKQKQPPPRSFPPGTSR